MGSKKPKLKGVTAEFVQEDTGDGAHAIFDIVVYPKDHPSFFKKDGGARKKVRVWIEQ